MFIHVTHLVMMKETDTVFIIIVSQRVSRVSDGVKNNEKRKLFENDDDDDDDE